MPPHHRRTSLVVAVNYDTPIYIPPEARRVAASDVASNAPRSGASARKQGSYPMGPTGYTVAHQTCLAAGRVYSTAASRSMRPSPRFRSYTVDDGRMPSRRERGGIRVASMIVIFAVMLLAVVSTAMATKSV